MIKRKITGLLLGLLALMALPMAVSGANTIKIDSFAAVAGSETEVSVSYTADGDYIGFQTQVTLPEGLSFVKSGNSYATLTPEVAANHVISSNADGQTLKVVSFSSSNAPFGRSGRLFTFRVKASSTFKGGTATIANTIFSTADFKEVPFGSSSSEVSSEIPVGGITIDFAASGISGNTLNMYVGDGKDIKVNLTPADATQTALTWSSSNPTVATVDNNGHVVALAIGTTEITVTAESGVTAKLLVNVIPTPATSITFTTAAGKHLLPGETFRLEVSISPATTTDKRVIWSDDNPDVALVDENGNVTAIAPGTVVITATTSNGI